MPERVPEDELAWGPHPKSMSAGQLSVYLRLLDVPVGAVCGPSFDEDVFV